MRNLTKQIKKVRQIPPLLAIAVVFFLLAFITLVAPSKNKIQTTNVKGTSTVKQTPTSTPTPTTESETQSQTNNHVTIAPSVVPTLTAPDSNSNSQSNSPTPTPTTQSQQQNQNQNFQVNLTINGSGAGQVNVTNGQNQCDVLNDALSQGKISSLNMRYDNNVGSNAVYQINGVGKTDSVWWVYTVNGSSPAGCSGTKASSGDNIEWKYIGS